MSDQKPLPYNDDSMGDAPLHNDDLGAGEPMLSPRSHIRKQRVVIQIMATAATDPGGTFKNELGHTINKRASVQRAVMVLCNDGSIWQLMESSIATNADNLPVAIKANWLMLDTHQIEQAMI